MPDLSHENWSNWWVTALLFLIIALIVAIGYFTSRPIKKSYTGKSPGLAYADDLEPRSVPRRPIVVGGIDANAKPLKDAPRRSMHRDDSDFVVPMTTGLYVDNPVHGGPVHNDNHSGSGHSDGGFGSGGFGGSDSSSSSSSDSGGSSGGGDGGGGGGGD